jgi:hypothetical protein
VQILLSYVIAAFTLYNYYYFVYLLVYCVIAFDMCNLKLQILQIF